MDKQELKSYIMGNYSSLEIINLCSDILQYVMNDIYNFNDSSDLGNEEIKYLDLGNDNIISKDDFESLCSFLDTLYFIKKYNKE